MNLIDKWFEITNPEKAVKRQQHRMALSELRSYDAARPNRGTGGYSRRGGRASDEVARAHRGLAGGAQDLVRNTAIANRIKAVIASNMVGNGIKPDYIGGSKRRVSHYKTTFDAWANSRHCDYEGHYNLWGLQNLWAGSIVESGGVFVRKIMNNAMRFPLVLQTLEQQYLDEAKSGRTEDDGEIISGIHFNRDGSIKGYWLKTRLQGAYYREESEFFPAEDIIHIFWKGRPGEHLGVSWLHPIADLIDQRQEWRDATLMQQRIAACFGVIIKEAESSMGLNKKGGLKDEDGLPYSEVEAGMIGYTSKDTDIVTVTPPNLNQTTDFNGEVLQDIAVGVGVTREQITGDFSKVTWASGRLARGEFYANLDRWQNFMMLPALDQVHDWFDDIYTVMHGKPNIKQRSWILPHRSAVNPKEELEVDIKKVRTGAMTPQQFTRKHGVKFEDAIQAWKEAKEVMEDLPFDFDPSKFSAAGNELGRGEKGAVSGQGNKTEESTDDTE
ncbi:phage portal protein [Marinobacterium stanieri]|uniref:phage portal protein n=1 Tax=Marinobacterium stanieri TaxID=49186 RepID=UPI0002558F17|nr:phage portal protein [Marinobacterium stanieri]